MGAIVPPTMSPERVGRIPHIAAIGMNLLIITLRRHASYWSLGEGTPCGECVIMIGTTFCHLTF